MRSATPQARATLASVDYVRKYDFVTRSLTTKEFIRVEVKASEVGLFRVDKDQGNFDTAVLSTPGGATVAGALYKITGVRYEGVDLAGNFNARWQQGHLYWRLKLMDAEPVRTVAPP